VHKLDHVWDIFMSCVFNALEELAQNRSGGTFPL
jgi:hypothetical protein